MATTTISPSRNLSQQPAPGTFTDDAKWLVPTYCGVLKAKERILSSLESLNPAHLAAATMLMLELQVVLSNRPAGFVEAIAEALRLKLHPDEIGTIHARTRAREARSRRAM